MAVISNFGIGITSADEGAALMPKLQYRFRVTFSKMGGNASSDVVTKNVISVSRPALDHDDVTVDTYNSKIRLAGKHMWQDLTLVLRDDVDSEVIKHLDNQLSRQVNHNDQASSRAGSNYKFNMVIETLDGGTPGETLDRWELIGCFIPSVQYGDLNYSASDMVQVTATIRFDNASHHIGDASDDLLSKDGTPDQSSSVSTS